MSESFLDLGSRLGQVWMLYSDRTFLVVGPSTGGATNARHPIVYLTGCRPWPTGRLFHMSEFLDAPWDTLSHMKRIT